MEFLKLVKREVIYEEYFPLIKPTDIEEIDVKNALNRVSAEDVISPEDLPPWRRSTVDGYAVCAEDTKGAIPSNPVFLSLKGEIKMGELPKIKLKRGEAFKIYTGGILPEGATAVVMNEYTNEIRNIVEISKGVQDGENVVHVGEDVRKGEILKRKGDILRPQDIGALLAVGINNVKVYRKPFISIIPTGDELVEPETEPGPGKIREINTFVIKNLFMIEGYEVKRYRIIRDSREEFIQAIKECLAEFHLVLIAGGSSKGTRDFTVEAISSIGKPGVLFHGVHIKPGKPTIFAIIDGKPVLGLPGHPVSSFISSFLFALPAARKLEGKNEFLPHPSRWVKAGRNIPSQNGREEWIRVKMDGNYAIPIFSESAIISSLVKADGLVKIPLEKEGVHEGEEVEFYKI